MSNAARFAAEQPTVPKSRVRKWLRRIVVAGLVMVVGVVAAFFVWRQVAWNAREAEIAKIRAAGEPVWFAELKPEPLHPAEDGTPLLRQAFAAMKPLPDELVEEVNEFDSWQTDAERRRNDANANEKSGNEKAKRLVVVEKPDIEISVPGAREKNLVGKLRPHVEANRGAFVFLRQAIARPKLQFAVDYDDPMPAVMISPEDGAAHQLGELVRARLRCELHDGKIAEATGSLVESLELSRRRYSANRDRLIGAATGPVNVSIDLLVLSEMISRGAFDENRSVQLSNLLADLEAEMRAAPAIRGERAAALTTIESFLDHGGFGRPAVKNWLLRRLWEPILWINETNYLRSMSAVSTYADRYDEEARGAIDEVYARENEHLDRGDFGSYEALTRQAQAMLQPTTLLIEGVVVAARNQAQATRVGLRIDAFRRNHGRLPESLDQIKGGAIAEIPRDVVRGEPFAYIVAEDAFAVCPANDVDRERNALEQRVKDRDRLARLMAEEIDARNRGVVADDEEEEIADDDRDWRSHAFRVVYPRTSKSDAASNGDGD